MIKKLNEVKPDLDALYTDGIEKGKQVGWEWGQFPYTVKLGSTTYIAGAPASGKSEFWFEILINLSCLHGWNHVIFSPETGTHIDIYSEIMHKFIGKTYIKGENRMSETEKMFAEEFVGKHFFIVHDNSDITINDFYTNVENFEKENNITIHTTTIDPWNELKEEFIPEDLGREDRYLSRILGMVRKQAKTSNKHHCVITHVRDQRVEKTDKGVYYYPFPTARDFAGGQVWFRKGMTMIVLWRPPVDFLTFDDSFALDNEVHVKIAKTKPKGTSKNGTYKFFLNTKTYRYYVSDFVGKSIYSNRGDFNVEQKEITIPNMLKPNEKFDTIDFTPINESPF